LLVGGELLDATDTPHQLLVSRLGRISSASACWRARVAMSNASSAPYFLTENERFRACPVSSIQVAQ
jgi:hypothetical protein